jgi:hypothetical protein
MCSGAGSNPDTSSLSKEVRMGIVENLIAEAAARVSCDPESVEWYS